MFIKTLAAVAIGTLLAATISITGAVAQTTTYLPIENEPPPKLFVDPPQAAPLARGAVFISYRVENLHLVPVLGAAALDVTPRIGHLHVTVDDLPWHWGDFGGNNLIVIVGMPPGQHKVLVEIANPQHEILGAQTVTFTVPEMPGTAAHQH